MPHIRELPTNTLLEWWAEAELADQYTYVVRQAYPLGYTLTKDQVRREVQQRLQERKLLPANRAPKPADYARIKKRILSHRYEEENA